MTAFAELETTSPVVDLDPAQVLRTVSDCVFSKAKADADLLAAAAAWADLNPPTPDNPFAADWFDGDGPDSADVPEVTESAIPEFAAKAGLTTAAGSWLMYEALLLRRWLPRTWLMVQQCRMPAFRAQQLITAAHHLGAAALRWLDDQTAAVNGRIGRGVIDRMVARAAVLFDQVPDADRATRPYVRVDHRGPHQIGVARLDGQLEVPDAIDLDAALDACSADRKAAGTTDDRDARRAMALGDLARHWLAQDILPTSPFPAGPASSEMSDGHPTPAGGQDGQPGDERQPAPRVTHPRELILYVHLSSAALTATPPAGDARIGECGATRSVITPDQVRRWCGRPGTTVVIKPVIDLNEQLSRDGHDPTPYRERTALRDRTCVFPFCDRPAHPVPVRRQSDGTLRESTDADHITPWRPGDATTTDGLAHLCRRHHRTKTHHGWRYRTVAPGWYVWTSPHRFQFLRTPSGTIELSEPDVGGRVVPGWLEPMPPERRRAADDPGP